MVDSRWAMAITVLPCHQLVEIVLDRRLDLEVERGGGLVEHQDRRVLQQHAGDRDTLALAAGELDAALAHMGVVAACGRSVARASAMKSCARHLRRPRSSRPRSHSGRPEMMLSRTERCSSEVSWVTMPIWARSSPG